MSRIFDRSSAAINSAVLAALAPEPDDRVLEVGFGGGALVARLAPPVAAGFVAGADSSADMVAVARRRLAPVVATLPPPEPAEPPSLPALASPALLSAASTALPVWPTALIADEAPMHFLRAEFQLTSYTR